MSEWTPPEQVWVACDGMHWSVRATPTAGEFVPYVPESRLAEVASKARELQWVAAKYGEPADLATERDALRERLAAVERERDALRERLAARLDVEKSVAHLVVALRSRVEELEAALREMVDCLDRHDGWCGHSLGSPGDGIINEAPRRARAALEAHDRAHALLSGGSREKPRPDTTCKHLINCGEGCGCDEPEPRPDTGETCSECGAPYCDVIVCTCGVDNRDDTVECPACGIEASFIPDGGCARGCPMAHLTRDGGPSCRPDTGEMCPKCKGAGGWYTDIAGAVRCSSCGGSGRRPREDTA